MLTAKQKEVLRALVGYIFQICHRHEDEVGELEAHRIKRGNAGGKYHPNNILMTCNECHKDLHGDEFT